MPSLVIPEAGLSLESSREFSKLGMAVPPVFGLTLSDGVIEEMIKCFQENKPIQLSLGDAPKISYGSKTQNLSPSPDPFTHELYHTSNSLPDTPETMKITRVEQKYHPRFHAMFAPKHLKPKGRPVASTHQSTSATKATASKSADDAALADLQRAMATETAKKAGNTTKYIKDGSLPLPGKRGPAATNKSKFLQQNRLGSDTTRSMPTSPALSSVGSPSLGATSVPLSQQKADQAKATRRPIIHLLAASPLTEVALRDKVEGTKNDIKLALEKVADLNSSTGMWELGKKFYKDLDVWAFQYPTNEQRQQAIDNAVKQYDKMRIGVTEPEWDRLLPKEERGTGKCLSKLQAAIATGTARPPKINVSKAEDSGRDTPMSNDKESLDDKPISRVKGESMARSVSNPPASKTKKTSEREAQTKRLFSNSKSKTAAPKAAAPAKTTSAKKAKAPPKEEKGSALSSQFVEDSDDESEEKSVVTKPAPKAIKRQREDEVDNSDSSNVPLSKKVKKDPIITHRTSDVSHSSRSTNYSTSSKNKGTSPQKSSPLASSPPTNASEFEGESASNGRISSSASPYDAPTHTIKRKREDVDEQPVKRHASSSISSSVSSARPMQRQKSSSVSSSDSSTTSHSGRLGLPNDIPNLQDLQDLARRYKLYYPKYVALRSELAALHFHDPEKEDDCRNMFERLSKMKNDIFEMLRSQGLPTSKTHSVDWRPMTNGGKIDYRTSSINF